MQTYVKKNKSSVYILLIRAFLITAMILSASVTAWAGFESTSSGTVYVNAKGKKVTGWNKLSGSWYYFDQKGIMQTGFAKLKSKNRTYTYYLGPDGRRRTGFFTDTRGNNYYANRLGRVQYGSFTVGGKHYFANKVTGILLKNMWRNGRYYYQNDCSLATNTYIGSVWVGANGKAAVKVKSGFVLNGSKTYYYNESGKRITGWVTAFGNTYYMAPAMKTGWFTVGKSKYYAQSDGAILKNAWQDNHYLTSTGAMATGLTRIGENDYYFSEKGTLKKSFFYAGGKRYFAHSSQYYLFRNKWFRRGGKTFYATDDCSLASGLNTIGGKIYYFNKKTCVMVYGKKKKVGRYTYYFTSEGNAITSEWVKISGKYYYFGSDGKMAKNTVVDGYTVGSSGARGAKVENGWKSDSKGKKYILNGNELKGWNTIGSDVYYFDSDGYMLTGLQAIDSGRYYFYSTGALARSTTLVIGAAQYTIDSSGLIISEVPIEITGSTLGARIAEYAIQFVGNPYVWGGTDLENGADCSGFVMSVFLHFGIQLMRVADDQMDGPTDEYIKLGYKEPVYVAVSSLDVGDLIFYDHDTDGTSDHVAIYIGDGKVVHASNSKPYPSGGIKISSYNYETPIKVVRYWL